MIFFGKQLGSGIARTPTILQMEAVECGATALGMVLAYHGRWVSPEVLRIEVGVSSDGSNAAKMIGVARSYGLNATGYRKKWDHIDELDQPSILFWGFNHFVVYEGRRGSTYWINDPNLGHRKVDEDEFRRNFTGVALQFKKTPEFKKGGHPPRLIIPLVKRLLMYKRQVLFLFAVGLLLVIPGVAVPGFLMIFVDNVLQSGEYRWMIPLIIIMLGLGLVTAVTSFIQHQVLLRLKISIGIQMVVTFLEHCLNLPKTFYAQRASGDVVARVRNTTAIANLLGGRLALAVLNLFTACFFLLVLFMFNVPLTFIAMAVLAVDFTAVWFFNRRRSELARSMQQDIGREAGALMAGLEAIDTLKANGQESAFFQAWSGFHTKAANRGLILAKSTEFMNAGPGFLNRFATQVLVIALGGLFVMDGVMSIGGLVAYQALLGSFMAPVAVLVGLMGKLQTIKADLARVDDVLGCPRDVASLDHPAIDLNPASVSGRLEMKGVILAEVAGGNLNDRQVSFSAMPGARVGIIGPAGSGKSVIADLIAGLIVPESGSVEIDGIDVCKMPRRFRVAVVTKVGRDETFFEGMVHDNITLWDSTIDTVEIRRAAEDACIHDDILKMKDGYSAVLTPNATNISGGQKQRLSIARALVRNPRVIVLDGTTSALDSLTEQQVIDNLHKRGCTTITITQRISSIRESDYIIVLDDGVVVDRGTHDQLASREGLYRKMVESE